MILRKFIFFMILIFLCLKTIKSLRSFEIRFTRSNCIIISTKNVALLECAIIELPRNRGNYLSSRVIFNKDIDDMTLNFTLSLPGAKNKPMTLKFRADGCKMATYRNNNPLMNAISKKLLQAGNFPKNCPLKANFTYTVDQFAINPDYFPGYTPEMNFTAKLSLYMRKTQLLEATIYAGLTKKK